MQGSELSFDEGDLLFILDQSDPNWWMARLDDKKGYIPSNYGECRHWSARGKCFFTVSLEHLMYLTPSVMSAISCSEQGECEDTHHWCSKAWQSGPSTGVPGSRDVSQLTGQKWVLFTPCSSSGRPYRMHSQVTEGTQVGDKLAGDASTLVCILLS